jgi:FlaA1/EpsC-like NDP-sugar epimerase
MRIFVTGITGTLGRAMMMFSRHEIVAGCARDWHKFDEIQSLSQNYPKLPKFHACDIRDTDELTRIFKEHDIDAVVNAAAVKSVGACNRNPYYSHSVNATGAANASYAAVAADIGKFLQISSDKAVEPVNIYGMQKAVAERLVLANKGLCSQVIRYGNVLGSRGSVFWKWIDQINASQLLTIVGPLPIVTRYWMTFREAVTFIDNVLEMDSGLYVRCMNASSITALAEVLFKMVSGDLATLNVLGGVRWIGLGQEEKQHESLINQREVKVLELVNEIIAIYKCGSEETDLPHVAMRSSEDAAMFGIPLEKMVDEVYNDHIAMFGREG